MRTVCFRTLLAAILIGALATVAQAQMDMGVSRIVSFGLGGGVSVPVSDAADAFKTARASCD